MIGARSRRDLIALDLALEKLGAGFERGVAPNFYLKQG